MKILKKDLKHGEVKLLVETPEDVWYLSQIIDSGDTLKGKTPRKVKATEEATAEKRLVFLSLQVEKIDFEGALLRATGKILDGPEDVPRGTYHSFVLEPGIIITVIKPKWYSYQLDRLKEAAELKLPAVIICVFDRECKFRCELEDDFLGTSLADSRGEREGVGVLRNDGSDHFFAGYRTEDGHRQFGSDTAGGEEDAEQVSI